jgi:hypothetical protein
VESVLPSCAIEQYRFEFLDDTVEVCSWAHVFRDAHMLRRVSPVISHTAMLKQFPNHRNIKHLENGLHRHATHIFLKYTSTGGYAKNPILLFPTVSQDTEYKGPMQCRERLGGLLKYYTRDAA